MQDIEILDSYEINSADVIKAIIKFEKHTINSDSINQIKVIETHISSIYLTSKFAYKQKKKVNFGFLDYTSLEKRKFYCRKELSLNRRSCSGIYIDMPELRIKNDGNMLLGYKKGKIIDYLVRMKRVAEDKFLDRILANDKERCSKAQCRFADKGENINDIEGVSNIINIYTDTGADDIAVNSNTDTDTGIDADAGTNTCTDTFADIADIDKILQKIAKRVYLFHKNANSSKRISMFGKIDTLKENFDDNYSGIYNFICEEKRFCFDALNNINDKNSIHDINNINNANNINYLNNLKKNNSQNNQNDIKSLDNQNNQNDIKSLDNQNSKNSQNDIKSLTNQNNLKKMKNIFYDFINSDEFAQYIKLRIDKGLIKDCHGDLRMEHIVVGDISKINGICILDCVEFSEKLRFQDIYLDFAFLLMDMEHGKYFYESGKIFEYYKNYFSAGLINLFQEYEFKVILTYKLYRALVRCKINILQIYNENKYNEADQNNADTIALYNKNNKIEDNKDSKENKDSQENKNGRENKDSIENKNGKENNAVKLNEAVDYFNLAMFYAELLTKPVIVMNVGLPGSGKSALSRLLSRYLNASLFTSDKIRKELFASEDVYLYDKSISKNVYEYMFEESAKAVELKKSVIMDATFLEAGYRKIFIDYFTKKYCNFIVIYSKIYKEKENIIIERLKNRKSKPDFRNAESLAQLAHSARHTKCSEFPDCSADRSLNEDCQTAGNFKLNDFDKDYSDADEEVYLRMKKTLDEPVSQSIGATVLTVDASIELKDRYNCILTQLYNYLGCGVDKN